MEKVRLFGTTLLVSTTLLGGQAFAEVSQTTTPTPDQANTPIHSVLTLNDENLTPPTPPTEPEGGTDEGTGIDSLFGIAYAPGALTGSGKLQEQGTTTINLKNASGSNERNKHNVGVQDKTRGKDRNWHLTAQLEWTNDTQGYLDGATITATGGNLKLNDGEGNLNELTEDEVSMGSSAENVTISKQFPVEIMKANVGKTVNGVYNYQFTNPQLVIPNSETVTAGSYSGNIVWNLTDALGGEQRTVTVKYVSNETGQEVHPAKTISGNQGESYDVSTSDYKLDLSNQRCSLDTSRLPNNATGSFDSNPIVIYYYNVTPLKEVNGSFEEPKATGAVNDRDCYLIQNFTSSQVPGWTSKPLASGVWDVITLAKQVSGSNKVGPVEGEQFTKLNTNKAYYQDFETIPGETLHWEVYHRAVFGTNTAAVEIGSADALIRQQEMVTDVTSGWVKYTGSYKVPEGQTKTRVQLSGVSGYIPSGFNDAYANLIDAFKISSDLNEQ